MMTYTEAKNFNQSYTTALRMLIRARKPALVNLLARQDEADGRTRLIGGPRTKDEIMRELLDHDYPRDRLNEAIHVLHHAPSARWPACEHCQAKPSTTSVTSDQLVPGDIVLEAGMRIRVDEVRAYHPAGSAGERGWSCPGTVLNVDEVLAAGTIPESMLHVYGYTDGKGFTVQRRDGWTIQGTALAVWIVELPRPAATMERPL